MRAEFDRPAVLDDADPVGIDDGLQAVRHHDGGAPDAQLVQRLLHLALGFGVERRRRLVEQDDRRLLQEGARDGDALALAARQLGALLADVRCRSRRSKPMMKSCAWASRAAVDDLGLGRRRAGRARCCRAIGAAEQEHVLRHEGDGVAQRARC